jgi:hypothetical protein
MAALTVAQIEQLWISNGGDPSWAPTMAGIAEAESGGNPSATNPSGATGLWQIEMPLHNDLVPGATTQAAMLDPNNNAKAAVALLGSGGGITAWKGDVVGNFAQNGQPLSASAVQSILKSTGQAGGTSTDWVNSIPGAGLVKSAVGDVTAPLTSAASALSGVEAVAGDLTSATWWHRIGIGVLGVALVGTGLLVFFAGSKTGQKTATDVAKVAPLLAAA